MAGFNLNLEATSTEWSASHHGPFIIMGENLVPTRKEAGSGLVMSKDGRKWKEIKLSKKIFGQRDGVAWLVDNRHSMEMSSHKNSCYSIFRSTTNQCTQ
jgi:hypothetical protein